MQTLAEIRRLLDEYALSPRKSLGQNFLIDHNLIRKLVDASGVRTGDLVLEVGPGTGALTGELLARGCQVIAGELDAGLARLLRDRLGEDARFTLVEGDCLESKHVLSVALREALGGRAFSLVANLPYAAATPLILALLADHPECRALYVTIQKEVGVRLSAAPGSKSYGSISVIAQLVADMRTIATLPRECFWPRPQVTSVMIAITRRPEPPPVDPARLGVCCRRLFGARRKQLGTILGPGISPPAGVRRTDRVETLSPTQIAALCENMPSE
jgi:16S rRNA (adenine1518-N6/adenine1519-N6)-dimethyltransferase